MLMRDKYDINRGDLFRGESRPGGLREFRDHRMWIFTRRVKGRIGHDPEASDVNKCGRATDECDVECHTKILDRAAHAR